MSTTQVTLYEIRADAAWITLNRPERRNALSAELVNDLYRHIEAANADDSVRCIVLTGAGTAFCSGADLKSPPGQLSTSSDRAVSYPELLTAIMESPKPVIAAVNGPAFAGGLGLVGASDIILCDEAAQFSFSEVRIGAIPAMIAVVCLPKLGRHQGMRLFLTGERFNGREAVALGLVHLAVPGDQLVQAVQEEIGTLGLAGPIALRECKKLVRRVPELSVAEAFAETAEWSARVFRSEEAAEGMAAFREKRKASWVGVE